MKLRTSILSLSILSILVGAAAHADTALGRVQAVDPVEQTLTLQDGTSYHFNDHNVSEKLFGFRPGDTVTVQYVPQAGSNSGKAIMSANDFEWVGEIASVNPDHKTVTLDDGVSFNFGAYDNAKDMLTGFHPGDMVEVNFLPTANGLSGVTLTNAASTDVTGVIKAIDTQHNTITLDTGMTYPIDTSGNGQSILTGFRVGDNVQLHLKAGQTGLVTSIGAAQF